MKFKLNQKVKTPKGEGEIVSVFTDLSIRPYQVRLSNGLHHLLGESELEPIPPTLQERWDSGERFRGKQSKGKIKDLHVFKSGRIAIDYAGRHYSIYDNEDEFFSKFEPIPAEPETRWVNVFLANDAYCKHSNVTFGNKHEAADISFQQKLENGKWVNV